MHKSLSTCNEKEISFHKLVEDERLERITRLTFLWISDSIENDNKHLQQNIVVRAIYHIPMNKKDIASMGISLVAARGNE